MKTKTLLVFIIYFSLRLSSQTVVKMTMPVQPEQALQVMTLYDEEIPLNTTVVLGAMGYSVIGGTAPYTFQWLKNNEVFATGNIAVLQPESGAEYTLRVTDKKNCYSEIAINVDASEKVSSGLPKNILITPTVVIDGITVSFVDNIERSASVRIFNGQGVQQLQTEIYGSANIPLHLTKGTYYVVIESNKEYVAEKIIVQ